MKTLFFYTLIAFFILPACAQGQRTSLKGLSLVNTSTGRTAQLDWTKGDEKISFFIVERSDDGLDFKQCAIVFLSDESGITDYKFRDKIRGFSNGMAYRIGIVNEKKEISYLPARKLMNSDSL